MKHVQVIPVPAKLGERANVCVQSGSDSLVAGGSAAQRSLGESAPRYAAAHGAPSIGTRTWSLVPLLLLITAVGAVGVMWLIRFRLGQITGWDESGYIGIALRDTTGLESGGLISLLKEFEYQGFQAPLLPLATVPVTAIFGNGVFQSLLALQLFAAALIAVTYALARTLLDRTWSLLAAACVGTMPAVADFSRLYVFAVPAAVFLTACAWALIRSDRLRHRRWVVGAGVLAGLMLLSRTMTLAFVPVIGVAALGLLAAAPRHDRLRRGRSLILAGAATLVVAASWYLHNALSVAVYLLNYGYGGQSELFGQSHSAASWGYWVKDLQLAGESFYLPLATMVTLGIVLASARFVRSRVPVLTALGSPAFVLAVMPIAGYLMLTTSKNEGTGFVLPLLPPLTVLAVAGAARLRQRAVRSGLAILFVTVCATNLLMKSSYIPLLAQPRAVPVPGLGSLPLLAGRGLIQLELAADGYPTDPVTEPLADMHKRWLPLMRQVTSFVVGYASARGQIAYVVFGSDDHIFNMTRAYLADALWFKSAAGWSFIGEIPDGDRVSYYRAQLNALGPNFVELAQHDPRNGPARITPRYVRIAARSLGYRRVYRFRLPDGRLASLWYRKQPTLKKVEANARHS